MKLPRLSTILKYVEMLEPEQRETFAKYALSLNEDKDRKKLLKEVEDQADADWESLTNNQKTSELELTAEDVTVRRPSLVQLFYQCSSKSNGMTCRQAMINNLQELRADLSRGTIEKFVDSEARKLGIPKAGKMTVWNIPIKKQMELPI